MNQAIYQFRGGDLKTYLKARNLKYGIASLCIGGGEASAMLIEVL